MRGNSRGHSLLEVFLAMLLMTLVIFAVVSLYPGCMASIRKGHQTMLASNLAQQYLEQIRVGAIPGLVPGANLEPSFTPPDEAITFDVTVNETTPVNGDNSLTDYQVVVTWNAISSIAYDTVLYHQTNSP